MTKHMSAREMRELNDNYSTDKIFSILTHFATIVGGSGVKFTYAKEDKIYLTDSQKELFSGLEYQVKYNKDGALDEINWNYKKEDENDKT